MWLICVNEPCVLCCRQELIPLQWEWHRLLCPPVFAPWAVLDTPQEDACQEEITQSGLQWKVSSQNPSDISRIDIYWFAFLIINATLLHSEAHKLSWCLELFHHRFEYDVSLEEVKTRKLDVSVKNNKMLHTRERKDIGMVGHKALHFQLQFIMVQCWKCCHFTHALQKKQFIAHYGCHISAIAWITDWILKFCSCQQVMVDFAQLDLTKGVTDWYEAQFSTSPWFVLNSSSKSYFWGDHKVEFDILHCTCLSYCGYFYRYYSCDMIHDKWE